MKPRFAESFGLVKLTQHPNYGVKLFYIKDFSYIGFDYKKRIEPFLLDLFLDRIYNVGICGGLFTLEFVRPLTNEEKILAVEWMIKRGFN